jgi:hypothetical protein
MFALGFLDPFHLFIAAAIIVAGSIAHYFGYLKFLWKGHSPSNDGSARRPWAFSAQGSVSLQVGTAAPPSEPHERPKLEPPQPRMLDRAPDK